VANRNGLPDDAGPSNCATVYLSDVTPRTSPDLFRNRSHDSLNRARCPVLPVITSANRPQSAHFPFSMRRSPRPQNPARGPNHWLWLAPPDFRSSRSCVFRPRECHLIKLDVAIRPQKNQQLALPMPARNRRTGIPSNHPVRIPISASQLRIVYLDKTPLMAGLTAHRK
jgi:hypothetical protein